MNKTKIEWTDYTWNPITGCLRGCEYCYARKITERFPKAFPNGFKPTFHPSRLKEPLAVLEPSKIFTCSMSDFFGAGVDQMWQIPILGAIAAASWHQYQILTKCPENINPGLFLADNIWLGVTVTSDKDQGRIDYLNGKLARLWHRGIRFVSFEPLHAHILPDLTGIDWVIIGAQTNPERQPEKGWVDSIVKEAREEEIPVFMKNNLRYPEKTQDFPILTP